MECFLKWWKRDNISCVQGGGGDAIALTFFPTVKTITRKKCEVNMIRKYHVVSLVIVRKIAGTWTFNVLARTTENIVKKKARKSG